MKMFKNWVYCSIWSSFFFSLSLFSIPRGRSTFLPRSRFLFSQGTIVQVNMDKQKSLRYRLLLFVFSSSSSLLMIFLLYWLVHQLTYPPSKWDCLKWINVGFVGGWTVLEMSTKHNMAGKADSISPSGSKKFDDFSGGMPRAKLGDCLPRKERQFTLYS